MRTRKGGGTEWTSMKEIGHESEAKTPVPHRGGKKKRMGRQGAGLTSTVDQDTKHAKKKHGRKGGYRYLKNKILRI